MAKKPPPTPQAQEPKPNPADRFGGAGPGRPKGSRNRVPINRQLKDMRYVYKTEKGGEADHPDDTPGQKMCRAMCRENPKDFLAMLLKMEQEHRGILSAAKKADATVTSGPSEGTKELVAVIDNLLEEWEESRGN